MKKILVNISMMLMLVVGVGTASAQTSQIGPVDSYGFLNAPDGSTWSYTASFVKKYNSYTMVTFSIYDSNQKLIGTIVDSLKFTDSSITGINQAELNPLVTQKFFNDDDKYEIMLFLHAQTKDYNGRFFNHVFSLEEGQTVKSPITSVNGRQVSALNMADKGEDYLMIFERDSASLASNHTLCYDVRSKMVSGSGVQYTFRVPYKNVAALTDLQPIYMLKNGQDVCYVLQQYEKPYFKETTSVNQDLVVNSDNRLVIKYIDKTYKTLYTTKIPVVQDGNQRLLYTFPMLGGLNGAKDVVLNNSGAAPAYIITNEKYNLDNDGSVKSYYQYDINGTKVKTIVENTEGRVMMSPVAGQEDQWLFLKQEYNGEFLFVDFPSCKTRAEISVYMEDGRVMSSQIDRYPKGNSYEYAVAMKQGNNEKDGTVSQDIAWLNADGSFNRYEKINLGKYIEAAQVNITAEALNPKIIHTDDAREYMALVQRYNPANTSDKETALLICNTNGKILLDYGKDATKGELKMVYLLDKGVVPMLLCLYVNGDALTLQYTRLPLNTTDMEEIKWESGSVQMGEKFMIGGQIYILRNDGLYTISGVRVK